jgi:phosphatidylinositol 3-kinase
VPDVVLEGERAVLKLQEKLRLEMTSEEAEVAFQQLVDDSVSAFIPVVIDIAHDIAQRMRS